MTHASRRLVRLAATTLCAAVPGLAASAAQASAATITVDKACYVNLHPYATTTKNRPLMTVTGSGFGANDPVDISGGSTVFDAITADANGNFVAQTYAPTLAGAGPGSMLTTVTASDQTTGVAAATPVASANLAVSTSPGSVRNVRRDRVTFRFSGFTPGQHVVGYYLHRRLVARSVFGRAQGPCGTLHQRALLYPGGRPRYQTYKVTFESVMRYSKAAFPHLTGTLDLFHF